MIDAMNLRIVIASSLFLASIGVLAEEVKIPLNNGEDKGTVGVQKPDGQAVYGGVDTSTALPTYSAGAATGGDVSFSAGASSDGKKNNGVKAGLTIKY